MFPLSRGGMVQKGGIAYKQKESNSGRMPSEGGIVHSEGGVLPSEDGVFSAEGGIIHSEDGIRPRKAAWCL